MLISFNYYQYTTMKFRIIWAQQMIDTIDFLIKKKYRVFCSKKSILWKWTKSFLPPNWETIFLMERINCWYIRNFVHYLFILKKRKIANSKSVNEKKKQTLLMAVHAETRLLLDTIGICCSELFKCCVCAFFSCERIFA